MIAKDAAWDLIAQAVADPHPIHCADDFREMVEDGRAVMWCGERSAVITQVSPHDRTGARVLDVAPAGGDLDEILRMAPMIEDAARAEGCTQSLVTAGRRGFARALKSHGYEEVAVVLRKMLV